MKLGERVTARQLRNGDRVLYLPEHKLMLGVSKARVGLQADVLEVHAEGLTLLWDALVSETRLDWSKNDTSGFPHSFVLVGERRVGKGGLVTQHAYPERLIAQVLQEYESQKAGAVLLTRPKRLLARRTRG